MSTTAAATEENNYRVNELITDHYLFEVEDETLWLYVNKVLDATLWDNYNEFVELVRHEKTVGFVRKSTGYAIAPSLLLHWTVYNAAPRCAEALLSGAAGVFVDLDAPRMELEMPPLYEVLADALPEFVELFIKYGARFDDKCDNTLSTYYLMRPIEVAHETLRGKISHLWLLTQPVYDLIFTLCGNMETKPAVIGINHLLRVLPVEQTEEAICHYARKGSIVDLAVLLYVDAISNLGIFKGIKNDEYIALCECVASNTSLSLKKGRFFVIDGNGVSVASMEKHVMKSLVLLLQIFYHTDFSLLGFDIVPGVLKKRMNNAGFDLTVHEAIEVVKCIKPMVELPQGVCGTMAFKPTTMEYGQPRRVFARNFHGNNSVSSYPLKSKASWSFKPILMATHQGQVMKAIHEGPQVLSLRRTWPALVSAAFRRISRV